MKKLRLLALLALVGVGFTFVSCDSHKPVNLKSDIDSVSYVIGAFQGYQLRMSVKQNPDPPINMDALISGFVNAAKGDSVYLGMELQEAQTYLNSFFQGYQVRVEEKNKAEADKFLAENSGKSGVKTTESGLQYKVITEGTGPKPALGDKVRVHYNGTLLDGTVFDSSIERGQPEEFPVEGVIPGFKEGLQLMSVGSKYMLWVPIELGYYNVNHQLRNKFLIFEVELLDIIKN